MRERSAVPTISASEQTDMDDNPPQATTASSSSRPAPTPEPEGKGARFRVIGLGLLVVVAIGGAGYWFLTRNTISTDDAFVEADVVQISPKVGGAVVKVHIADNQHVKAGDPLFDIDPRDFDVRVRQAEATLAAARAKLETAHSDLDLVRVTSGAGVSQSRSGVDAANSTIAQAQAQATAAEAQSALAKSDVARYRELFDKDEISRQRLDQAVAAARAAEAQWLAAKKQIGAAQAQAHQAEGKLDEARSAPQQVAVKAAQVRAAEAEVAQAEAALAQARLDLSYTHVVAPVAGRVTKRSVFEGMLAQMGQATLAIVYGDPWVVANFKETQLARMKQGQPVSLRIDAFPGRTLRGHVDSFPPGTGARFSLLPPENATGNYVKVVQRVPVKILIDATASELELLAPGMSVQPDVDVGGTAAQKPSAS